MNLEGNSNVKKEQEAPRAKQVVSSATMKKQSELKKFKSNIVSEDAGSVVSNVMQDVVYPKIKDLLVSAGEFMVRFIFWGSRGGSRSNTSGNGSPRMVSYENFYAGKQQPTQSRRSSVYDVNDVSFGTRAEAEDVLFELRDILNRYQVVRCADFYDSFGGKHDWTANNYGWYDLSSAKVVPVRDGYSIVLPKPTPIN